MKIPGMGVAMAPFKDIGKAFNYGFDMPGNVKNEGIKGLVSGFSPHFGGAATGAGVGLAAGMMLENVDPVTSTVGGAAVGAAALPALGLMGAGAYGLGSGIINNSDKIVSGAGAIGKGIGKAAYRAAVGPQFTGTTKTGKIAAEVGNRILNPVGRYAGTVNKIAENFVSYEPRREVYNPKKDRMVSKGGFKMKPLGWGVIGLGAVIGGAKSVNNSIESSHMGVKDPYITRATPRIPSYANDAGASGDLVFALNANRRG